MAKSGVRAAERFVTWFAPRHCITHSALNMYPRKDLSIVVFLIWQLHVAACGLRQATVWAMIGACLMSKHQLNTVQTSNFSSVI